MHLFMQADPEPQLQLHAPQLHLEATTWWDSTGFNLIAFIKGNLQKKILNIISHSILSVNSFIKSFTRFFIPIIGCGLNHSNNETKNIIYDYCSVRIINIRVTKNTRYTSVYRVFFMTPRDEPAAVNDEERVNTKKETERREARQVRGGEAAKGAKRPPSRRKNKSISTDIISNSL